MLRPQQESRYTALAAQWHAPGARVADLLDPTRAALAALRPGDLDEVGPLAEALVARLARVRRSAFTAVLEPEAAEPWTRLVLQIVREADYAFGDLLRSREETDPRVVAFR